MKHAFLILLFASQVCFARETPQEKARKRQEFWKAAHSILQKQWHEGDQTLEPSFQKLISNLNLVPTYSPSFDKGKKIYDENCVSCHGSKGRGDGVLAQKISQKIPSFSDKNISDWSSPAKYYLFITYGNPTKTMPSFEDNLNDDERWHVAFYAMTMTVENDPKTTDILPTLQKMSEISNATLRSEYANIGYLRHTASFDTNLKRSDQTNPEFLQKIILFFCVVASLLLIGFALKWISKRNSKK